ncbi:MAG: hypothetical protein WCV63_01675 [Negativicutes bacterium]|jgi:hypothetical protein
MFGKTIGQIKEHCCAGKCPMSRAKAAYKAAPKKTKIIVGAVVGFVALLKIAAIVMFVRKKFKKNGCCDQPACCEDQQNCCCDCGCTDVAEEKTEA